MSGLSDLQFARDDERQRRYLQMLQKVKNNQSALSSTQNDFGLNGTAQQFSVGSVINNSEQNLYPDQSMQQILPSQQLFPGQPLAAQQFYNSQANVMNNHHRPVELASNAPTEMSIFKVPTTTGNFNEYTKFKRELELLMPNCYEINKTNLKLCLRMFKAAIHYFRYPPQGISFADPASQLQYISNIVANQYYSNQIPKSFVPSIVSDQRSAFNPCNQTTKSVAPSIASDHRSAFNPIVGNNPMMHASASQDSTRISTNQSSALGDIMSFLNDSTIAQRRDERAVHQHSNNSVQQTLNGSRNVAVKNTPKPKGLNKSRLNSKKADLSVIEEQRIDALSEGGKSVTRSGRVIKSPACFWKANDSGLNSTAAGRNNSTNGRKKLNSNEFVTPRGRGKQINSSFATLNNNRDISVNYKKPTAKKIPVKEQDKENKNVKPKKPANSKKQSDGEKRPAKVVKSGAAKQTEDSVKRVSKKRKSNTSEESLLKKRKEADVSTQQQINTSSGLDDDYSDDDLFSDLLC